MAGEFLKVGVRGEDGTAKPLRGNDNGAAHVIAKNREVEEIIVMNSKEIRDVVSVTEIVDLSKYSEVKWKVFSTLNENPKLLFSSERKNGSGNFVVPNIWNGTEFEGDPMRIVVIEQAAKQYDITSKLEWLKWGKNVGLSVRCEVPPTSGSITVIVEGKPN